MIKFNITRDNIHIVDSYRIRGICPKRRVLMAIRARVDDKDNVIWKRSMASLITEWVLHNILYDLGIARDHTRDVDLDMHWISKYVSGR